MINTVPKWVLERYSKIWKTYKDKKITFAEIEKVLVMDDKNAISVFLNEIKNAGWINVELDENDSRKRLYQLKNPEKVVMEMKFDDS